MGLLSNPEQAPDGLTCRQCGEETFEYTNCAHCGNRGNAGTGERLKRSLIFATITVVGLTIWPFWALKILAAGKPAQSPFEEVERDAWLERRV